MNIWIIKNASLKIEKIDRLVERLRSVGVSKGHNIECFNNDEVLPFYSANSKPAFAMKRHVPSPDAVIFWDKDVLLARHFESRGERVFNSSKAIELCDNKASMMNFLANSDIRVPRTILAPKMFEGGSIKEEWARVVAGILGDDMVLKEAYGSFGMQVYRVCGAEDLYKKISILGDRPFIVQEYISTSKGRDIRVNIIGDKIIGAILRENDGDFRANISLGGRAKAIELTEAQRDLALRAHKLLGLDFSGVDLLFGEDDEPILCEVNSNVNFLSFEEASGIDFAGGLLDYIKRC